MDVEQLVENQKEIEVPSLLTISIKTILNQIGLTNQSHIGMLKSILPKTVYKDIKRTVIGMFNSADIYEVNLKFLKSVLLQNDFEKHASKYLEKLVNCHNDPTRINIMYIKEHINPIMYSNFLAEYLYIFEEIGWDHFLATVLTTGEEDILHKWDFTKPLSEEQYMCLMYIPTNRMPQFAERYNRVVVHSWEKLSTITASTESYSCCKECMRGVKGVIKNTKFMVFEDACIVPDLIWNMSYWCCRCERMPLFQVIDESEYYTHIDYITQV